MTPARKPISRERLRTSVVRSTMATMRIEGRLPLAEPRLGEPNGRLLLSLKSASRRPLG
jgi:hypothetical protein